MLADSCSAREAGSAEGDIEPGAAAVEASADLTRDLRAGMGILGFSWIEATSYPMCVGPGRRQGCRLLPAQTQQKSSGKALDVN